MKKIKLMKLKLKKKRRIKFDLDKNVYFQFLVNDIITSSQVRVEINGVLKNYQPKKVEDEFYSHIIFEKKSSIKPFDKNKIGIDKNYQLRENMEEIDIIPELYEDLFDFNDDTMENLANSLKSSIDKSTNISTNESMRRSFNQSIMNSIRDSSNNEAQGLIRRLRSAFQESVNQD